MYMSRFLTSACLSVSWAWHLQESTGPEDKIIEKAQVKCTKPLHQISKISMKKSLIHSLDRQRWFRRLHIQSRAALFLVWTAECIASPPAGHKTHKALLHLIKKTQYVERLHEKRLHNISLNKMFKWPKSSFYSGGLDLGQSWASSGL